MNQDKLAQARRFYHHVINGGKLTPEDVSYMVSALEEAYEIWMHNSPEKSGAFFVCGEGGERDEMGLPEMIMVCPAYGLDGFAIYKKEKDYSASE